jgi:hypothetical protein
VLGVYLTFVRFAVPDGETVAELTAQATEALRRALAGDPSGLAASAPYDWRAACADAQAALLRPSAPWPMVPHLWWESARVPVETSRNDPVVLREIVPAWVARSRGDGHDLAHELTRTPEPVLGVMRECLAALESGEGLVADFGYAPEFAAAADEARGLVASDPDAAWRIILAALPAWRPMGPNHLAPMGLLYDRDLGRLFRRSGIAPGARRRPGAGDELFVASGFVPTGLEYSDGWATRGDELLATPRGPGA